MPNENQQETSAPSHVLQIGILVIAVIIAVGVVLYMRNVRTDDLLVNNDPGQNGTEAMEDDFPYNGNMRLDYDGRKIFSIDENIRVTLYANSDGMSIGGYDAVFVVPEEDATLVSAESLIDDFTLYTNTEEGLLSVTGVKDLNADVEYIFNNEPIAVVEFKPQRTGAISIDFDFQKGETRDSNLVIPSTDDVLASVEGVTVYVGEVETAQEGSVIQLDVSTTATVVGFGPGPADCIDCPSTAELEVTQGNNTEKLTFSTGGIANISSDSKEAFGYLIEVGDIAETSLQVRYIPTSENETP